MQTTLQQNHRTYLTRIDGFNYFYYNNTCYKTDDQYNILGQQQINFPFCTEKQIQYHEHDSIPYMYKSSVYYINNDKRKTINIAKIENTIVILQPFQVETLIDTPKDNRCMPQNGTLTVVQNRIFVTNGSQLYELLFQDEQSSTFNENDAYTVVYQNYRLHLHKMVIEQYKQNTLNHNYKIHCLNNQLIVRDILLKTFHKLCIYDSFIKYNIDTNNSLFLFDCEKYILYSQQNGFLVIMFGNQNQSFDITTINSFMILNSNSFEIDLSQQQQNCSWKISSLIEQSIISDNQIKSNVNFDILQKIQSAQHDLIKYKLNVNESFINYLGCNQNLFNHILYLLEAESVNKQQFNDTNKYIQTEIVVFLIKTRKYEMLDCLLTKNIIYNIDNLNYHILFPGEKEQQQLVNDYSQNSDQPDFFKLLQNILNITQNDSNLINFTEFIYDFVNEENITIVKKKFNNIQINYQVDISLFTEDAQRKSPLLDEYFSNYIANLKKVNINFVYNQELLFQLLHDTSSRQNNYFIMILKELFYNFNYARMQFTPIQLLFYKNRNIEFIEQIYNMQDQFIEQQCIQKELSRDEINKFKRQYYCNANGVSDLMVCVIYNKKIPQFLLSQLNLQDRDGKTALMYATHRDQTEIIKQLQGEMYIKDNLGNCALHYAIESNSLLSIGLLMDEMNNVYYKQRSKQYQTSLSLLAEHKNNLQKQVVDIYNQFFVKGVTQQFEWYPVILPDQVCNIPKQHSITNSNLNNKCLLRDMLFVNDLYQQYFQNQVHLKKQSSIPSSKGLISHQQKSVTIYMLAKYQNKYLQQMQQIKDQIELQSNYFEVKETHYKQLIGEIDNISLPQVDIFARSQNNFKVFGKHVQKQYRSIEQLEKLCSKEQQQQ